MSTLDEYFEELRAIDPELFRKQYMQEPVQTLAESLIPKKGEMIAVLAHSIRHFDYFVGKICLAANNKEITKQFFYVDREFNLRGRQWSKVIRLEGWWAGNRDADEIDRYIVYRKIDVLDIDDRKLDEII